MADFSFITERLACGAQLQGPDDIKQIIAAGITHIVDAQQERNDGVLIPANCIYLWDPTADDGQHKPPEWFAYAITFAANAFLTPRAKLLTHCAAGVNRGPSLAYAIMRSQGWSDGEAMLQLKTKRPQVNVAYHDDANAALASLGWVQPQANTALPNKKERGW
jgi:dual specificity phosphatase 3